MAWLKRGTELTWCVNRCYRFNCKTNKIKQCHPVRTQYVRWYQNGPATRVDPTRSSKHIRQSFIDFFKENDHLHVPSSSIIPRPGEGTYFTNAGMNQFKPLFLGTVDASSKMASYRRVVNSQRCVRVGGKHNDLDDVGKDTTHHTFFEMLGSWSFGDYFKKKACAYAWDLLTNVYQIPPQHLYVTYFGGDELLNLEADLECKDIWLGLGVPPERVIASGVTDNFWDMGETGPCGPCTEIHYAYKGSGKLSHLVNTDNPAILEIWNLVFMQFDRQKDGSLISLPKQHVDTGMGLERITAVLQGVQSNYDTDLFTPIFRHINYNCSCPPYEGKILGQDRKGIDTAYRIVADHMRMVVIALADGLRPGNKDQDSKVRQILYRALKQSKDVLRAPPNFLSSLVPVVINTLDDAFPANTLDQNEMRHIINHSEQKIYQMEQVVAKNLRRAIEYYGGNKSLTAEQVLEIHEGRFGNAVSIDVLEELCLSQDIKIDVDSVNRVLEEHKIHNIAYVEDDNRAQMSLNQHQTMWLQERSIPLTDDTHKYIYSSDDGSYAFPPVDSEVLAILQDGEFVDQVQQGQQCGILLRETCFYAEAGGQVADVGYMRKKDGSNLRVEDVKSSSGYVLHSCIVHRGELTVGDAVTLSVNQAHRQDCMRNHTGTHLINYALEKVFGNVRQQGSMVSPNKLTFDFSCSKVAIGFNDIQNVAETANKLLHENLPVYKEEVHLEKAQSIPGLRSLQDEVYPAKVRVVSVGAPVDCLLMYKNNSSPSHCVELCGGTHVDNTGELEALVVTNFKGLTQGTRRITAVTGSVAIQALEDFHDLQNRLRELSNDIFANHKQEEWLDRAEYVEKKLSDGTVLPKLERDALQASLDQIKCRAFSQTKNATIKEKLAEQIQLVLGLHTTNSPLVTEFPFKKARDLVAVLAAMEVKIPLLLLSAPPRGNENKRGPELVFGVCYVPEGSAKSFTAQSWAKHVAHYSKGTYHDPKGKLAKKGQLIQIVSFPAVDEALAHAKDLATTYANLYREP